MKTWTLNQLMFASEVCFPDTFLTLWAKHGIDPHLATYFLIEMQRHGNVVAWMLHFSRTDLTRGNGELSECFDNILTELIGDYGVEIENDQ